MCKAWSGGPQERLRRNRWLSLPFVVLCFVGCALLLAAAIQANVCAEPGEDGGSFCSTNVFLSDEALIGWIVATGGWWLLRDRDARAELPLLGYDSRWTDSSELLVADGSRFRLVELKLRGRGPAIFKPVHWHLQTEDAGPLVQIDSLLELHGRLGAIGLRENQDYAIANWSDGATMDPGDKESYFEGGRDFLEKVRHLLAVFEFESPVGDRYRKVVSLLPHVGAPSVVHPE